MAIRAYGTSIITYTTWSAITTYNRYDNVVPTSPAGQYYICTMAGISGASEPSWDTTPGNTTQDGAVIWTCQNLPTSLTVVLNTGGHGGLGLVEIWVKGNEAITFTVYGSHTGVDGTWRWMDELKVPHAGRTERHEGYLNAYRYIKVYTDSVAETEAEIVAGEM